MPDICATPGPWFVEENIRGIVIRCADDLRLPICEMPTEMIGDGFDALESARADADLIAAAPELLAACKELLMNADDRGETHDEDTGEEYSDWAALRRAIAKTEGSAAQ